MVTRLLTHPASQWHDMPPGHPECVDRIRVVEEALAAPEFAALDRHPAPRAAEAEVLRCHPQSHIDTLRARAPAAGIRPLDADTHIGPASVEAALHGVGAACAAVDAVIAGAAANAFCAMRPPGHHAEAETPMGFCFFGNVAIAAKRALDHHGLSRVAVVDFDVHHGNGTQDLLWDESRVRFVSSQQMPLWPGSGAAHERGAHRQVTNIPLPPGTRGAAFRAAWTPALAALDAWAPELVIVSAGFDAHAADPLAQLALEVEDFVWITRALCDLAAARAGGRLVSVLEGGYDLDALAACVAAHVRVLMEAGQ
ncbi:histone deacetylase family protein [Rhodobaculum claviforme]|uniref:Acetoin utilization protein n=1 Tax=Rhodobaculum claviforme TaxID=1549854 RepID=A0A934TMU2_9RHOB|nr:histone deacetylase family protein [Rhodobaculum claviforme]MBK5928538.1 acetoin utilization protein [Rhodobaculum claviforme]